MLAVLTAALLIVVESQAINLLIKAHQDVAAQLSRMVDSVVAVSGQIRLLNVAAKDLATGKAQTITISGSSGLSKSEVERMVREAESHAAEDKARRELIEARNQADALAYQVEKTVQENRDALGNGAAAAESAV